MPPELLKKIAEKYGTPCYVYLKDIIEYNFLNFQKAFGHVHYAVKANSNLSILKLLANLGAGFDIVSGGELARVLKASGNPEKIVFSGVGKQDWEIENALNANIACFNVESFFELEQIQHISKRLNKIAPVSLRINPDISVKTHPYITTGLKHNKFGIPHSDILKAYDKAKNYSHLKITGIACHLGSQIFSIQPYLDALEKLLDVKNQLAKNNIYLSHIDIGGGFGIDYDQCFDIQLLAQKIQSLTTPDTNHDHIHNHIWIEPGRAIVANSGLLLTRVISVKPGEKKFVIVDCAMNDLIRPALYDAHHEIISLQPSEQPEFLADIAGPICETGDFLAKDRKIYAVPGDLLAVTMTGAYGFSMSSNYNSRPRCPEILLDGETDVLIRRRETLEDLMQLEINE